MFASLKRWWRRKSGAVELNLKGFVVFDGQRSGEMNWGDVCTIELGRRPTAIVEDFYVTISSQERSLVVADSFGGFERFQSAVLERWPEIEDVWTKIYTGRPELSENRVVWTRAAQ